MTIKTFNDGIKMLKRFLKEEGQYIPIFQKYLFRKGRPINDLFKEFNNPTFIHVGEWTLLFDRINLIQGRNKDFSYDEYCAIIKNYGISLKWKEYYIEKSKKNKKRKLNF